MNDFITAQSTKHPWGGVVVPPHARTPVTRRRHPPPLVGCHKICVLFTAALRGSASAGRGRGATRPCGGRADRPLGSCPLNKTDILCTSGGGGRRRLRGAFRPRGASCLAPPFPGGRAAHMRAGAARPPAGRHGGPAGPGLEFRRLRAAAGIESGYKAITDRQGHARRHLLPSVNGYPRHPAGGRIDATRPSASRISKRGACQPLTNPSLIHIPLFSFPAILRFVQLPTHGVNHCCGGV